MDLFIFKFYIFMSCILLITFFQMVCYMKSKEKFEYTLECENEILNTFLENV